MRVDVRVDQVLDRAIDRSRVLIHAVLNVQDPFVHRRRLFSFDISPQPFKKR